MGLRFYRPDMPSAALHPRLLPPARSQPTEIGVEGVYRQVHCMMPRHYSMHCEWLGNDRDSGCSPEGCFPLILKWSNSTTLSWGQIRQTRAKPFYSLTSQISIQSSPYLTRNTDPPNKSLDLLRQYSFLAHIFSSNKNFFVDPMFPKINIAAFRELKMELSDCQLYITFSACIHIPQQ